MIACNEVLQNPALLLDMQGWAEVSTCRADLNP